LVGSPNRTKAVFVWYLWVP